MTRRRPPASGPRSTASAGHRVIRGWPCARATPRSSPARPVTAAGRDAYSRRTEPCAPTTTKSFTCWSMLRAP